MEALKTPNDVLARLGYTALRASGRIAFGCGSGDRKLRRIGVGQAVSWLYEYGVLLEMARTMQLLDKTVLDRLDSLRGRAVFYTNRLWEKSMGPPPAAA